ncbi:MAG: kdpA [Acidimicrobiales bacterium]|nr:kdpA [Acidimicrobiales bacterium]
MTWASWLQLAALVAALAVCVPFVGAYLARVFGDAEGGGRAAAPGDRLFGPIERAIYRLCGIDPAKEQRWSGYAMSVLAFSGVSVLALYALLRLQGSLPLNPTHAPGMPGPLAFNTAVSFVTNTDWQNYVPEASASHLTQMMGLAVQNFISPVVGLAVAIAFIRGLARRKTTMVGNFWVDVVRGTLRVFLPVAVVVTVVLLSQGAIQNLHGFHTVSTVQGAKQAVPGGPFASQEAIKMIGTNGGGTLNANSAHPLSNPNGFTNWLQIFLLLLIPFALTTTYGRMVKDKRQGWAVLAAMVLLWGGGVALATGMEVHGNTSLTPLHVDQRVTAVQGGGNMEGKEVRFGSAGCGVFAASTTATSTGAVNCAHDSLTPLGGMAPLVNMMLGEVSPGGVGAGLYGMLIFALLAVFIAGLMVGRTPEYLGKKIQAAEMKLVVIYIVVVPLCVLSFAAASLVLGTAKTKILNPGAHGLTEVSYAFTSAANNNGSAFGGLTGATNWYNTTLGISMLVGRFLLIVPMLAIAGSLVRKQRVPAGAGTFPTGTALFAGLLAGVVVIVVGLTYFPVLALGPIVEHLTR